MSLVAPSVGIYLRLAPLPTPSLAALSARLRRTPLANPLGQPAEHERIIALNQPTRRRGKPSKAVCRFRYEEQSRLAPREHLLGEPPRFGGGRDTAIKL
jgi:hypothetical protein